MQKISEHLNINQTAFLETGALDAILNVDTKLYISPLQLRHTQTPHLQQSYDRVTSHFRDILTLLTRCKREGDVLWRSAKRKLKFSEPDWLALGYSSAGNYGRGIGETLQEQLINTAKEIIDAGVFEPQIFELVGLLEDNVGPDLISDMIANIILPDILQYTADAYTELGVNSDTNRNFNYGDRRFVFPTYVANGKRKPIILIPRDILKPLPIMATWDDIDAVRAQNEAIRKNTNRIIGSAWSDAATSRKKQALRTVLLSEPDIFVQLIRQYKQAPPENYDFLDDPGGFISWLDSAKQITEAFPIALPKAKVWSLDSAEALVLTICEQFKKLIEDNGLSKELYNEDKQRTRHEETAQKLFFAVADSYCRANDLDLTRELDAGRGPVDFKFSSGYEIRILVEVKWNKNPKLERGYDTQLEIYKRAERTHSAIYMVIVVNQKTSKLEELQERVKGLENTGERVPRLFIIDGTIKPSASKA